MDLVIVESPTKAKTITRFLGKGYKVESSFGHVRDLPKSKLGVDVEKDFEPQYIVPLKAKKRVAELKKLAAKADTIYLASDEDREGEAIAWHLEQLLPSKKPMKRIAFHEITKEAILHALENPRELHPHMIDAQQARRVLDRLVGYELSPFLWRKIYRGLSAGRVQSVAVRLIVEREREIQAFKPQEFWSIDALVSKDGQDFEAALHAMDGKALKKFDIATKDAADTIVADLKGKEFTVASVEQKERNRKPNAPFTTSTLQQEGNNTLGFSAKQTMMIAQQLYEGVDLEQGSTGLITYMRTDSVNLAEKFLGEAETFINSEYGKEYADRKTYATKSKGAQEAHEAIRPTDVTITPDSIRAHLDPKQFKLYDLIWRRAVASQMKSAVILATTVDMNADKYTFRANGSQLKFDGWLKIAPEKMNENVLPQIAKDDAVDCKTLEGKQHFTEPPQPLKN
jgi:DNA topoisomerase-1